MRRTLLVAALVAAAAAPSVAGARSYCEQRAHDRRITGTLLGAAGGALVGGAIGDGKGALIGGLGGAVVGNQVARTKCYSPPPIRHSRTSYPPAPARAASKAAAPRGCSYENRRYYDERGQVVYTPTKVCR